MYSPKNIYLVVQQPAYLFVNVSFQEFHRFGLHLHEKTASSKWRCEDHNGICWSPAL